MVQIRSFSSPYFQAFPNTRKYGPEKSHSACTIFFNVFINNLPSLLTEIIVGNGNNKTWKLGDPNTSLLLFANNLVIFSLSQKEMLSKINILEENCCNEGFELTINKTKTIFFSWEGANIKKFKFYCRNKEMEIGKQYTYLGVTITISGKSKKRLII